jgi:hypothetical protein
MTAFSKKPFAEGKTYTSLGDYTIRVDDQTLTINGKQHLPYVITYANSDKEVKVAVDMCRGSKTYYLISDDLAVKYVSTRKFFGVQKLEKELEKEGYRTSDEMLNRNEYYRQKIITSGQSWKRDNTTLVAAYFPMLLENADMLTEN